MLHITGYLWDFTYANFVFGFIIINHIFIILYLNGDGKLHWYFSVVPPVLVFSKGYENILLNPNVIVSSHSEALLFLHRFSYKQSVNLFSSKDRLKASFSVPSKVSFVYALSECSSVEERIVSMLSLTWLIFQNPLLSQVFQIYIQYAICCSY